MKTKNVTEKNMKVCLVGSSGGHLTHLYMLKPFWKDKNRFWVTFDIRIVRQIKNSLAPSDGEIRFSITAEMGFQWLECKSTFVSSEQPKVPEFESKTEKAAYLIKKLLSDGDMRAREIYMRMKDEGISRRTAENTKKELGIRSYRKMRQWYWSIHTGE